MYEYKAIVVDVHDGDTVTVDIDLGLSVWARGVKIRLAGINAPELPTPEGVAAAKRLNDLVFGKAVNVITAKDRKEKYGRYVGEIFSADGGHVNALMVQEGHAVWSSTE